MMLNNGQKQVIVVIVKFTFDILDKMSSLHYHHHFILLDISVKHYNYPYISELWPKTRFVSL